MMRGGSAAELRGCVPGCRRRAGKAYANKASLRRADAALYESPEARGQAQAAHGGAAEEEDPDVALARALMARARRRWHVRGGARSRRAHRARAPATQEEETREWNTRMMALAGLPAPGGARDPREGAPAQQALTGSAPAAAEAAQLEGMGVDEAYEEQGAVDVDGMSYEARPFEATFRLSLAQRSSLWGNAMSHAVRGLRCRSCLRWARPRAR